MCGVEPGDEGSQFVPCCENGHWLHVSCLKRYVDEKSLACPLCRSTVMRALRQTAGLPQECLERTPASNYGAAIAVRVGMSQISRAASEPPSALRRASDVFAAILTARL